VEFLIGQDKKGRGRLHQQLTSTE